MSTNGTPTNTTNLTATGKLFGLQQHQDENAEASDNNAGHMESKNSQIWQPTNQLYLPLGLSSTPLQ
jgi:hypothetical protein